MSLIRRSPSWQLAEREAALAATQRLGHEFERLEVENHGSATKKTPGNPRPRQGHEKQGARQGGTEPGTPRFRDGRKTTGPPAPRRGPVAPAAELRPRGPSRKSAQV